MPKGTANHKWSFKKIFFISINLTQNQWKYCLPEIFLYIPADRSQGVKGNQKIYSVNASYGAYGGSSVHSKALNCHAGGRVNLPYGRIT